MRLVLPQDLSGTWRVQGPRGSLINRSGGQVRHQRGERVVEYRFNDLHLRGGPPREVDYRVLVLGDSYTFGWLLQESDTFVSEIGRLATSAFGPERIEFLNGGAGGWGTADCLAFLEDSGGKIQPDAVLVFLNGEDISRSVSSNLFVLAPGDGLRATQGKARAGHGLKRVANGLPGYGWLLTNSHLVQLARRAALVPSSQTASAGPASEAEVRQAALLGRGLFRATAKWARRNGADLFVLTTGFQEQIWAQSRDGRGEVDKSFFVQAPEFFASEGIPFADIASQISSLCDGEIRRFMFPDDPHPNEAGAEAVADASWQHLRPWIEGSLARRAGARKHGG